MKMRSILATIASAVAVVMSSPCFGMDANDFKYAQLGDVPANSMVCTNMPSVISSVADEVNEKQDKFILGKNLQRGSTVFKLTLDRTDSIGGVDQFPYDTPIYSTGTNFMSQVTLYDYVTRQIPELDPLQNKVGARLDTVEGNLVVLFRYNDQETYVPVLSAEAVDKLIIDVVPDEQTACGYSHPYDWRVAWEILSDTSDSSDVTTAMSTNVVGMVIEDVTKIGTTLSKVKLSVDYLDEINVAPFNEVTYTILSGDATIEGDILTANSSGVVRVRATNNLGESRDVEVSCYRYTTIDRYSRHIDDLHPPRDRINDWHLDLLTRYRANPTTNRVYYTWNEPTSTKHIGYTGDQFGGQYGKHFFPYQHMTCNSGGGTGFWSTHGIISKHVLLAANHYGDWNHSRAKGMTVYVNWDNKFSGRTAVKLLQYVNLNTWAKEHGFTGTDASMGDIGVYVCRTLDEENVGIPDECLPYLATTDWLNATYGYNYVTNQYGGSVNNNTGISCISLNQGATIGLRYCTGGMTGSGMWSGHGTAFIETWNPPNYSTDSEDPIKTYMQRKDIALYARRTGWHNVVLGDSGQPVFLYDPSLTVPGKTYDFGDGPEPLVRPILLWSYCSPVSSTPVSLHLNVLRAFCESIGDSLDHVLGDIDSQSTDSATTYERAKKATEDMHYGPNAE